MHSTRLLGRMVALGCLLATAHAATVYYGGDILTMEGDKPAYVPALVVKGGKIAFTGSKAAAIANAGMGAKLVDLKGRTLMPGFIDAHAHLILSTHSMLNAELRGVASKDEVVKRLQEHGKTVPEGAWIEGMGYNALAIGGHPTAADLDKVSSTRPVFAQDSSGHHGAVNSVLMKQLKIDENSKNPEGGVIYRVPGTNKPDGHIAETVVMSVLAKRPPMSQQRMKQGLDKAVQLWVENGQTTATELGMGLSSDDIDIVKNIIDKKWLPIDLIVFAKVQVADQAVEAGKGVAAKYQGNLGSKAEPRIDGDRRYLNRVRGAGVKLWLDGSPPTALLSAPYKNTNDPNDKAFVGVENDSPALMEATALKYWDTPLQVHAHAVGDQAVENFIVAFEKAKKAKGRPAVVGPVLQHGALIRPDQIKRLKAINATASFTMASLYPMAKDYFSIYQPQYIKYINPAGSAVREGLLWTTNTDGPAGGSNSLLVGVWNAVNRPIQGGGKNGIPEVLNPEEKVSPYEALKSITVNVAKQHREEATKGTLTVGKLADLVILSSNPLKVPPMDIDKLKVDETIKEGKTVFERSNNKAAPDNPIADTIEGLHPHPNKFVGNSLSKEEAETLGSVLSGGAANQAGRRLMAA